MNCSNNSVTGFNSGSCIHPFKGARDIFSNMFPCNIEFRGPTFRSAEHAYQYSRAIFLKRVDIAEQILHSETGYEAKFLSNVLSGCQGGWDSAKVEIMIEILAAKAYCVPEFQKALMSTEGVLVEAVPGSYFWSCGLNRENCKVTPQHYWPGKNIMGELLMDLRKKLWYREVPWQNTPIDKRKVDSCVENSSNLCNDLNQHPTKKRKVSQPKKKSCHFPNCKFPDQKLKRHIFRCHLPISYQNFGFSCVDQLLGLINFLCDHLDLDEHKTLRSFMQYHDAWREPEEAIPDECVTLFRVG